MTYPIPAEHFPCPEIPEAANDAHWLIARTLPRGEFRAMKALNDLGIMAYCPCETKWRKTAKGKERVRYPLFQGYVFLGLNRDIRGGYIALDQARSADGVSGVVKSNGQAATVRHAEIARINGQELAGKFDYAKDRNAAKEAVTSIRMSWEQFASVGRDLIMDAVEGKIELANLAENMQEAA
jgi:transcription antitermination factor NusG